MTKKPIAKTSLAQQELDKAEKQFEAFDNQVKEMTLDRMNEAPKQESEGLKLSQKDIEKSKDIYLKPERTVSPGVNQKTGVMEKFNEKFREQYNFDKEYVQFVAEHKEIIGETIDIWTKPYPGMNCEYWKVPTNKPVWGPRYLAEQIKRASYHRLIMQQSTITGSDGMGQYYGALTADTTVQRLDAHPVNKKKSLFMNASGF